MLASICHIIAIVEIISFIVVSLAIRYDTQEYPGTDDL